MVPLRETLCAGLRRMVPMGSGRTRRSAISIRPLAGGSVRSALSWVSSKCLRSSQPFHALSPAHPAAPRPATAGTTFATTICWAGGREESVVDPVVERRDHRVRACDCLVELLELERPVVG